MASPSDFNQVAGVDVDVSDRDGANVTTIPDAEAPEAVTEADPLLPLPSSSSSPRRARARTNAKAAVPAPRFIDHFSLRVPSSEVSYHGSKFRVYDSVYDQLVLEVDDGCWSSSLSTLSSRTFHSYPSGDAGGGGGGGNGAAAAAAARAGGGLVEKVGDDGDDGDDDDDDEEDDDHSGEDDGGVDTGGGAVVGGEGGGGERGRRRRPGRGEGRRPRSSPPSPERRPRRRQYERRTSRGRVITVKRVGWTNFGLVTLRLSYTLVALLMVGFLFVFCFQVVLFLFLHLPVESGFTSGRGGVNLGGLIGTVLSVPVFLSGMAKIMTIGTTFVTDAWSGGKLIRAVMGLTNVVTEMLYFSFFLVAPTLTLIAALLERRPDPWKDCAYVWVVCVFLMFVIFATAVIWREVQACFQLASIHRKRRTKKDYVGGGGGNEGAEGSCMKVLRLAHEAMRVSQMQRYSGWREERYLVSGDDDPTPGKGYVLNPNQRAVETRTRLYSRLTQIQCFHRLTGRGAGGLLFDKLDPPVRFYTTEEIRDVVPFVTRHNWSLEAMCCRNPRSRMIIAAMGSSALKIGQVRGSLVCNIFSSLMAAMVAVGLLIWINSGMVFSIVAAFVFFLCVLSPVVTSSVSLYQRYLEMNEVATEVDMPEYDDDDDYDEIGDGKDAKGKTLVQVWETVRIAQPKPWLCYTTVALEVYFLFLWPIGTMLVRGNAPVALVFLFLGTLSVCWRYFDAFAVLSEIGPLNRVNIDEPTSGKTSDRTREGLKAARKRANRIFIAKSRLSEILGNISRSRSVSRWMWIFGFLVMMVFLVFLSAVKLDDVSPGTRSPIALLDDFYYPDQPDTLAYPTCDLTKGFEIPDVGTTALGDFAFLAALAYEMPNVTNAVLPKWFGEGKIVDESHFVSKYRVETGTANNPIYFKLFSMPSTPGFGIVSIRGSETSWDWLVNMQLWSASALAQLNKWGLPFGWIWSPILPELISLVDLVETQALKNIKYYKITSRFVKDVLEGYGGSNYHSIRVTGASLGGGLAIITGAQTGANAIAISGLGAELSRFNLEPPVSLEMLDNHVFNVIPDRDVIARVGGRSRLFQEIECTAPSHSLFGCHSMWRSVCEITFRCGSGSRPVLCRCAEKFGYPEPIPTGNRTFADACAEEKLLLSYEVQHESG